MALSHSAVICLTRTFASARCSRSYFDRFVIWSSFRIPGIYADYDTHIALIGGACLGILYAVCQDCGRPPTRTGLERTSTSS
jgi:hypothetical protein